MRDPTSERLGLAPLLVHVMGEEITGLTGMHNDIRLRDGAPMCLADLPGLKLLKILTDEHGGRQTIDDDSLSRQCK
jgi:hypothetical protein